jgi:archaellum component FlaC
LTLSDNLTDDVPVSDEAQTKPTLETIAEQIANLSDAMSAGFAVIERRLAHVETQLENMDMRLDGIESFAHQTRSEVLALRKEFKEFRSQFKEHV